MTISPFRFPPPVNYHNKVLSTLKLDAGTPVYRCYSSARPIDQAVFFGKTGSGRFSDPTQRIGVMYTGMSIDAALVETLFHSRPEIDAIPIDNLQALSLVEMTFSKELELVKFAGADLIRNDTTAEIFTCPHSESQLWAKEIIKNKRRYPGIYYPCRHNNDEFALALFEGRVGTISLLPHGSLDKLDATYKCLDKHGVGII